VRSVRTKVKRSNDAAQRKLEDTFRKKVREQQEQVAYPDHSKERRGGKGPYRRMRGIYAGGGEAAYKCCQEDAKTYK